MKRRRGVQWWLGGVVRVSGETAAGGSTACVGVNLRVKRACEGSKKESVGMRK